MKNFVIIRSNVAIAYYLYSPSGRLVDRFTCLADISVFLTKIKNKLQLRHIDYCTTCSDDVILVSIK